MTQRLDLVLQRYLGKTLIFFFSTRYYNEEEQREEAMMGRVEEISGRWVHVKHDFMGDDPTYSWINLDNVDYFEEVDRDYYTLDGRQVMPVNYPSAKASELATGDRGIE